MMQILNMLWIVVLFWLVIEFINSRLSRNRGNNDMTNEFNREMNK